MLNFISAPQAALWYLKRRTVPGKTGGRVGLPMCVIPENCNIAILDIAIFESGLQNYGLYVYSKRRGNKQFSRQQRSVLLPTHSAPLTPEQTDPNALPPRDGCYTRCARIAIRWLRFL